MRVMWGARAMNETLTLAIVGHLVGDYLIQNDWMATNKKRCWFPCAVHCFLWTSSVLIFTGWILTPGLRGFTILAVLGITHYIQDRTQIIVWWMRLPWKDQTKFTEPPMAPWSLIMVDNVWHIVTLWAVWKWIA